MALRVWLPLNGNLDNQGLSENNAFIEGSVPFENGKLGKAASFVATSASNRIKVPGLNLTTFSICLWFMIPQAVTATAVAINEGRDYNTFGWEVYINSANKIGLRCGGNLYSNEDCTPNTWYHVCITCNENGEKKYYINGELKNTASGSLPDYSESNGYINIGNFGYGTSDSHLYPFNGYINDVRIYDEVLSPKQIKEISKGLIAHYKLEASNINTNLAVYNPLINGGSNSISFDRTTNTYTMVAPVGDSTWGYGAVIGATNKCVVPYNSYYRFSFEVYVPTEHVLVVDYNNYSNDSSVASWNGNDNDLASARLANTKTIPANTWTKCIFGSQNAHASNTSHVAIYENSKIGLRTASDTESVTWYLRNFKFELDNKATDYVPYGYDPMEFLTTDVSGNGYNGIINGTLSYNADSPRYSSSATFNGSSYMTSTPGSMAWYNFDNLTISAWLNPTVTPGNWTGSIGIQLDGSYTSGRIFSISNYAGKFSVHTDTNSGWVTTQSETLPLNTWSHCVATLENGTNLKMYLNGQLVKTATLNWGTNSTLTASNSRISIGVDLPGDDEKYTGSYSDVRIYATALTADDILTLYKTSGIIDNKGNIYAYEFKEE